MSTGRRAYDEDQPVVPLRDFLQSQIDAVASTLGGEIAHVRADVAKAQLEGTREHAEVRGAIEALREEIAGLKVDDARAPTTAEVAQIARLEALDVVRVSGEGSRSRIATVTQIVGSICGVVSLIAVAANGLL